MNHSLAAFGMAAMGMAIGVMRRRSRRKKGEARLGDPPDLHRRSTKTLIELMEDDLAELNATRNCSMRFEILRDMFLKAGQVEAHVQSSTTDPRSRRRAESDVVDLMAAATDLFDQGCVVQRRERREEFSPLVKRPQPRPN